MRAVVSRVRSASVLLQDGPFRGERRCIGPGLLVLLGIGEQDDAAAADKAAAKILALRIFPDESGKFDSSVTDTRGELLLVSQFTLYGALKGGRRPDFTGAARPEKARPLYERVHSAFSASGLLTRTGEFGASMAVESINDGPVTIWLDTDCC